MISIRNQVLFAPCILALQLFLYLTLTSGLPATTLVQSEKYRPQIHFSVSENWLNDPNGMLYYDGEYHLFYQYHPDGTTWGPMHWGHAVTTDLAHWNELPIALYPDELGRIFSGSGVVDHKNSSGFQTNPDIAPIVAIFTHADGAFPQQQSIAFSNDKGRTFTKYEGNPVILNPGIPDFRDPKVILYNDIWVMVLAAGNKVMFYSSPDLKNWAYLSEFGANPEQGAHTGVWECPDLLKMTVGEETHWVLLVSINPGGPNGGSVTQYFVGNFDGQTFSSDQFEPLWMDWGTDNYAGVSFFEDPNGRQIIVGWMNNWDYANNLPTEGWRGQMTLPRQLTLITVNNQLTLKSQFVEELNVLENIDETQDLVSTVIEAEPNPLIIPGANPLLKVDLTLDISKLGEGASLAICFTNSLNQEVCTGFDNGRERNIFLDRERSGNTEFSPNFWPRPTATRISQSGTIQFQIYLDTSAIEVFVDDGLTALTTLFYPDEPLTNLVIHHHTFGDTTSELVLVSGILQGLNSALQ